MKSVKTDVYTIIREVLNIEPENIDRNTPWYELGAESFDLVELIVALRDHFKIHIETKDLNSVNSLNELLEFIERKVQDKGS